MPPPHGTDPALEARPYLIGPFDKLQVNVFGVKELTGEVQVDGSGRIALPLAGSVEAAGQTPAQVADEIARRLRGGYVRDPQVAVNLSESVSHVFTVEGEVEKPGAYPAVGKMTLLRAIARAEGTTDFAGLDDVIIFRTVGGERMAGVYNLAAIRRGNYDDPEVYADDLIVVGESPTRKIFRDVLQVAPAVVTPLVYILTR
ncbi:transposase [Sphingosinicella humi]|uniref:Transposase n=1 Tax=Allosphingosinicella humi TaxID=2068657 RepID=A0A2U2J669_9SPHN|nr:transposase [Sphingosinicella humi]